jgi:hypothetical protein
VNEGNAPDVVVAAQPFDHPIRDDLVAARRRKRNAL